LRRASQGEQPEKINFNVHPNRWLVIARPFIVNGASLVNAADPDPQFLIVLASTRIDQGLFWLAIVSSV
jgi:hypothetical protein